MQKPMDCVKAIVGPARSGTTWIGTIMDSHPNVVYRFEPFHRLRHHNPAVQRIGKALRTQAITDEDISEMYATFIKAHPLTNKPPFFHKKSYPIISLAKKELWPLSRLFPGVSKVYQALYSPKGLLPLVFKEVTFAKQMKTLLKRTSIPLVYIVRHPCATVISDIKGQNQGKMPTGRQANLKALLENHDPILLERYGSNLRKLTSIEKTALLWRIEVESCVRAVQSSNKGIVITYEQFAEDAYTQSERVFTHFGMNIADETVQFLDSLYDAKKDSVKNSIRSEGYRGNKYFTIYRNPKSQKNAWKAKISANDRRTIEAIVKDSKVFDFCASLGSWD
ncbi:MAG: sulfotransferase [Leptolyngbya sp. SIO1D8]|nr:sulfotransferase [Leptolyngbya sp. SIO1D8]